MTPVLMKLHIACGVAALVLGPLAMNASKRHGPHTQLGEVYHGAVFLVCLTAGMLAALDWGRIGWFLPVAAFSYASALQGIFPPRGGVRAGFAGTSQAWAGHISPW